MPKRSRIRILCVDDHSVVRDGLAALISLEDDMEVVASASDGEEAVRQYRSHHPDVTLMDLQLPAMSGVQAIRQIRKEDADARILVLTMYQGDEDVYQAVEAGASAYLSKSTLSDSLIEAIREVHAGRTSLPEGVVAQLATHVRETALTSREHEVLQLLAQGMRNKEISLSLRISDSTVETHVKNIFAKLHVHDRTAALAIAVKRGIVRLE